MATLAEQLSSVQAAIAAVESGAQSYTDDDGATIMYPALKVLYDREERLLRQIDRQGRGRVIAAEM